MFTGIVQAQGIVSIIEKLADNSIIIQIDCDDFAKGIEIGESINVDGVCLTVEKNINNHLTFTAISETINKTNFSRLIPKTTVNLERAATLSTFLGGHLVTGHVDKSSEILDKTVSNSWTILEVELKKDDRKFIIDKGSVTLNGVSLTISKINEISFEVSLIPQTISHTNLKDFEKGNKLNVEFDLIGKYVLNKSSGVN